MARRFDQLSGRVAPAIPALGLGLRGGRGRRVPVEPTAMVRRGRFDRLDHGSSRSTRGILTASAPFDTSEKLTTVHVANFRLANLFRVSCSLSSHRRRRYLGATRTACPRRRPPDQHLGGHI